MFGVGPFSAVLVMNTLIMATFADVAALGFVGFVVDEHVTALCAGTGLFAALDVAILAHAGDARIIGDERHDHFLSFVGAVLISGRQTQNGESVDVHQQSGDDQRKSEKVDHSPAVIHFNEAAIRMLHLRRLNGRCTCQLTKRHGVLLC